MNIRVTMSHAFLKQQRSLSYHTRLFPDSKGQGANMGPTNDPVGPM